MTEITGIATKLHVHVVYVPAVLPNIWLFALKCVNSIVTKVLSFTNYDQCICPNMYISNRY